MEERETDRDREMKSSVLKMSFLTSLFEKLSAARNCSFSSFQHSVQQTKYAGDWIRTTDLRKMRSTNRATFTTHIIFL